MPSSSGPRWTIVSFMRSTTSFGNASWRSYSKMPLIPHMCGIRACGRDLAACREMEVKTAVCLQHAAQTERLDSAVPGGRAQLVNEGWIAREELQLARKPFDVTRREQTPIDVVFDDFPISSDICREGGQAAGHGFQQGVRHSFVKRGQDENVHGVQHLGNTAGIAGKTNSPIKSIRGKALAFFPLGSRANEKNP